VSKNFFLNLNLRKMLRIFNSQAKCRNA